MTLLHDLSTPRLLLDQAVLQRNLERMRERVRSLGVTLRPHVKTAKSIEVIQRALQAPSGPVTVSTLREAEYCFEHGVRDILYAVGIAPGKLGRVANLILRGAQLTLILDNVAAVRAIAQYAASAGIVIAVLIELDVDGHRCGVAPGSELLLEIGRELADSRALRLRGVMTHAGGSYACRSADELRAMAERERAGAVLAAQRLRDCGWPIEVVSVGSTPTIMFARHLEGVTEARAGVYMFYDLVMAGLAVCAIEDIALSVLVTVIGHQAERGWIITDGGWMALSRDRGTASQRVDQGYGLVRDAAGHAPRDDLIVVATNQEHGVVARRDGGPIDVERYPIGARLRLLPNHACATGAQHERYHVVRGENPAIVDCWSRINGW